MSVPLALILMACGESSPPPAIETPAKVVAPAITADAARALVADSPEFSDYQFTKAAYSLPLSRSAMNEPARKAAAELARAKWISISGDSVSLSDRARGDKRFIVRPNGFVDIVPLAKKELTTVTGIRTAPDGAPLVDFEWRWIPNEIGTLFGDTYAGTQRATATLLWDGSAWTVLRIVAGE